VLVVRISEVGASQEDVFRVALEHQHMREACENRRVLDAVLLSLWITSGICLLVATWKNGLNRRYEGVAKTWALAAFGLWTALLAIAGVATWVQG
jgi:hypothetical protein